VIVPSLLRRSLLSLGWGAVALSLAGPALGNWGRINAGSWIAMLWLVPALALAVLLVMCHLLVPKPLSQPPSWTSRLLVLPVTLFTMLVAFVIGAALAGVAWRAAGDMAYRNARAEAIAAGHRWDPPPSSTPNASDDNAVTWIVRAGVSSPPGGPRRSADLFGDQKIQGKTAATFLYQFVNGAHAGTITATDLADAKALVDANRERLALLERAAAAPQVIWGIDYNKPWYQVEIPSFTNVHNIARLRAAEAIILARAGNAGEAAEKLRTNFWLANAFSSSSPSLLAQAVAAGVTNTTLQAAELVLPALPARRAHQAWDAYLKRDGTAAKVHRALVYEYFASGDGAADFSWKEAGAMFGATGLADPSAVGRLIGTAYWPFIGFDVASAYRHQVHVLACVNLPYRALASCLTELGNAVARDVWMLGALSMPAYANTTAVGRATDARMRLAQLAIAAKEYRETHHVWPESLQQLAGAGLESRVFRDPFGESDLRIRAAGPTLVVYSAGANGTDDLATTDDIVWKLDATTERGKEPNGGRTDAKRSRTR
jgi:hypothetical protein